MKNSALLIIDVQNGILDIPGMPRPAETNAALDAVVARIAGLLNTARSREIPVIFVQHDGGPGDPLQAGTPGFDIRAEIAPLPTEPVIRKTACDSFFDTTLDAGLKSSGVGSLIVTGCMTQYCIDTSVRRAVSEGYDVTLIADAHTTAGSGGLTFEQIIAHHNATLNGLGAGAHTVRVVPLHELSF